jgi:4-hydroxy-2-oxovalerate/4-hydroxy-2-oxohexanoate aldolase
MENAKHRVFIVDTTLRDGMHAVSHEFTAEQVKEIAKRLDEAGTDYVEVAHGDGLSGSSYNYGFSKCSDEERLNAANSVLKNSELATLLLPGIGTQEDLEVAIDCGVKLFRVATHCTEADIAQQHINMLKKMGVKAFGFLMMAHMVSEDKIEEQAKLFESYGADAVYVTDSAGAMLPDDVRRRISAVKENLSIPVGFHGHQNMSMAVANSLAAVEEGAEYIDATCRGLGAGAGNAQIEVLTAVLKKAGYNCNVDLYKIMDVAEEVVEPLMKRPQVIRTAPLMLGYAGVYSSFLLHTYRAAEKFNLEPRDILSELGRRKMVGGQEDMIIDVAYQLAQKSEK